MKHVKSLNKPMNSNLKKSGCGECQTSCQSACKTSCTVGNQTCEQNKKFKIIWILGTAVFRVAVSCCSWNYLTA